MGHLKFRTTFRLQTSVIIKFIKLKILQELVKKTWMQRKENEIDFEHKWLFGKLEKYLNLFIKIDAGIQFLKYLSMFCSYSSLVWLFQKKYVRIFNFLPASLKIFMSYFCKKDSERFLKCLLYI